MTPDLLEEGARIREAHDRYESRKRARAILDSITNPPAPEPPKPAPEPGPLRRYLTARYGPGPLPRDIAPATFPLTTSSNAESAPRGRRGGKAGRVARLEAELRRQRAKYTHLSRQFTRVVEELREHARAIVAVERKAVKS